MTYSEDEVRTANAPDFPADRNLEVCAAGAMARPDGVNAPIIDSDACVYCGVCVSRCPVGAIRLNPEAVVQDTPNAMFLETADNPEARMLAVRGLFARVEVSGVVLDESGVVVDAAKERVSATWSRLGEKFPNHLVRNLFHAVGIGAAMRRRGDNAVRMDILLGAPGTPFGVAEVEFGDEAVLDSPRDILDDVAVLAGRRGWDKSAITALIVSDVLPNRRSEYWRIIQDIDRVTGLRIGTVTVLALMLMVWNRKRFAALGPRNAFYVDVDMDSYRARVLEAILGRSLKLGDALRPHIEVAK
jgi:NAD-dependent dihydropyrimidine dehydrogenase PreA subunit